MRSPAPLRMRTSPAGMSMTTRRTCPRVRGGRKRMRDLVVGQRGAGGEQAAPRARRVICAWVKSSACENGSRSEKVIEKKTRGPKAPRSTTPQKSMMMLTSSSPTSSLASSLQPFSLRPLSSPPFMPYGTSRSRLLGKKRRISPANLLSGVELRRDGRDDDLQHSPELRGCFSSSWRSSF